MKKNILILLLLTFMNCFSQNKGEKVVSNIKNQKESIALKKSTLDSLQGSWQEEKDLESKIIIKGDSLFAYYRKEFIEKTALYLNRKCSDKKADLSKKNLNGSFLISYSSKDDYYMCYQIDYLSSKKMILFYEGNTIKYFKK